jgi:uncharacterized SAM-binding protein YcdF (DUF218 family)
VDVEHALRALLRCLVLPPTGPVLMAFAGLWLARRRVRGAGRIMAAALVSLLMLSVPVVADRLVLLVEREGPLDPTRPVVADVIVVLGGGLRRPPAPAAPAPGPETLERLAAGAALARRTGLPLLVTGGAFGDGPPEADVMQAALRASFGLDARFVERRARDTHENAVESARLLRAAGLQRILLVTSAIHMPRAVGEFVAAGLEVTAAPVAGASASGRDLGDWLPSAPALAISYAALYEALGQGVVKLREGR